MTTLKKICRIVILEVVVAVITEIEIGEEVTVGTTEILVAEDTTEMMEAAAGEIVTLGTNGKEKFCKS